MIENFANALPYDVWCHIADFAVSDKMPLAQLYRLRHLVTKTPTHLSEAFSRDIYWEPYSPPASYRNTQLSLADAFDQRRQARSVKGRQLLRDLHAGKKYAKFARKADFAFGQLFDEEIRRNIQHHRTFFSGLRRIMREHQHDFDILDKLLKVAPVAMLTASDIQCNDHLLVQMAVNADFRNYLIAGPSLAQQPGLMKQTLKSFEKSFLNNFLATQLSFRMIETWNSAPQSIRTDVGLKNEFNILMARSSFKVDLELHDVQNTFAIQLHEALGIAVSILRPRADLGYSHVEFFECIVRDHGVRAADVLYRATAEVRANRKPWLKVIKRLIELDPQQYFKLPFRDDQFEEEVGVSLMRLKPTWYAKLPDALRSNFSVASEAVFNNWLNYPLLDATLRDHPSFLPAKVGCDYLKTMFQSGALPQSLVQKLAWDPTTEASLDATRFAKQRLLLADS